MGACVGDLGGPVRFRPWAPLPNSRNQPSAGFLLPAIHRGRPMGACVGDLGGPVRFRPWAPLPNTKSQLSSWLFCLPGEAGKPGHLKEDGVTPTEGKTIRLARASLANGGV